MRERSEYEKRQSAEHVYHVWINRRQDEIRKKGGEWEYSLYEFKSLMHLLEHGGKRIEEAYTGKLRQVHQQCSRTAPQKIEKNCLKCCLGKDVTECEILVSIKNTFDDERGRECGTLRKFYADVPDSEMYRLMAQTCAWHIYKTVTKGQEGHWACDTSEGHLMDTSDRMFWGNVYASLAQADSE